MTTRWRPDFDPNHLYFVTTTAEKRAHLFRRNVVKRILVDSLYYVSLMNKVTVYAFVIMPNHVHVIIQCPATCPLKDWVRAFKGSSSRLIVRLYQAEGNYQALNTLRQLVTRPEKQEYKVWEDGYYLTTMVLCDILLPGKSFGEEVKHAQAQEIRGEAH